MKRTSIISRQVAPASSNADPATYDIIIRNGTIFDGLRTPRFVADVGIRGGKVATIGRISKAAVASEREIDATAKNICPGFVDLHTHYDSQIFWDPYCTLSGWHGTTSVVIGNCGFGFAPCKPEDRVRAMKSMERNEAVPYEAMEKGMPWDWDSFPEFLDSLDNTPKGVNLLSYVGLTPLLIYVMGLENAKKRSSTEPEMAEMQKLLKESMLAGACGFSAQILGNSSPQRDYDGTPMVTDTMSKDDLYKLGSVLSELGTGFIQVSGPSIKTTENLAKASGRPIIYNTITPAVDQHGQPSKSHTKILKWLKEANEEKGLRIFGQAVTQMATESTFTFRLATWNLFDGSPSWRRLTMGEPPERIAAMQDPALRGRVKQLYDDPKTGRRGAPGTKAADERDGGIGFSLKKLIFKKSATEKNKKFEGMVVGDIAEARDQHPIDCFLDISIEDGLENDWATNVNPTNMTELKKVATGAYCLPGVSDGGAHTKYISSGDYTTEFLAGLVRENDAMSLEEAHWRLAKYPAQAAGMLDRGSIEVGMPADVIVYDFQRLKSLPQEVSYDFPGGEWRRTRRADGYDFTIVNGVITFEGNRCTGACPGKLLRHGRGD